jgi:dTMP kinase
MHNNKAPFIVIEGTDGSGVSTQAERLERKLREDGREVYLTKEPTDGPFGAMLRLVLSKRLAPSKDTTESQSFEPSILALLFAADRMDHLHSDIIPKLKIGVAVISDRYYLSSYAFQGLDVDIEFLQKINSQCLKPDLTIFLNVNSAICYKRMQRRRWHTELFEEQAKLEEVRQNYLKVIQRLALQGEKIVIIDGNQPVNTVQQQVFREVQKTFSKNRVNRYPQLNLPEVSTEQDEVTLKGSHNG